MFCRCSPDSIIVACNSRYVRYGVTGRCKWCVWVKNDFGRWIRGDAHGLLLGWNAGDDAVSAPFVGEPLLGYAARLEFQRPWRVGFDIASNATQNPARHFQRGFHQDCYSWYHEDSIPKFFLKKNKDFLFRILPLALPNATISLT